MHIRFRILFFCLNAGFISLNIQAQNRSVDTVDFCSSSNIEKSSSDLPIIGAWFWSEEQLRPEGYKTFIDEVSQSSCYNLLSVAIRRPGRDITDVDVKNQIKKATEYANKKGIRLVLGLDPRLARRKFEAMYPDELQQSLWLNEVSLSPKTPTTSIVKSIDLVDHMNGSSIPYLSLRGSLLRVYAYQKTKESIDPNTLKDITKNCKVLSSSKDSLVIQFPANKSDMPLSACAMVTFTHLTPDVFAPHLKEFTQNIIAGYSDVPLAGAMRDEWGFPPSMPANRMAKGNHFWYSKYYAAEYARSTDGRELLADCLLMYVGIKGKEKERLKAINHYMELNWKRNAELEDDFYRTVKKVFGAQAFVLTHPTWYPYPNRFEFKKNGLYWWAAKRDIAQTDEVTPFAVRTALAKKWGSPVWYNQYYSTKRSDYEKELWSAALAGGRLNYHPMYPCSQKEKKYTNLLCGALMRSESRVHLLDYISKSPLDCPVAVIFGHASAMNWAGPYFEDVGMELVNSLWRVGIPTDLIPASEIEKGNLLIDEAEWIHYGVQRYAAVILYKPEFEKQATADFFNRAADGNTHLFRIGNWTHNFDGESFDGNAALPRQMVAVNVIDEVPQEISKILKNKKLQTPALRVMRGFGYASSVPPLSGFCRLIDGTLIQVAGTKNAAGDVINSEIKVGKYNVTFNALGVAAVRFDKKGNVQALAAGGLRLFKTGDFCLRLDKRIDLAFWKNKNGEIDGVIQGLEGEIPPALLEITTNWQKLLLPEKLER